MTKKLLAIAIAAGLAAPMAASADTTLFGQAHASIDVIDDGANSLTTVESNSSRIGFKGSEKLGNGLKAIYHMEWGVDLGGGQGDLGERNRFVGLGGGFGALILGRIDTPMKTVGRKADLFWSTQLGQNRNIVNPGTWDRRNDNTVMYTTPKMGGFQSSIAYVTDTGGDDDANVFSINGIYKAGGITAGAAYETHGAATGATNVEDESAYRLMAAYNAGAFKVVGFFQSSSDLGGVSGADRDTYGLGAAYKVGSGAIKAQYYAADDLGGAEETGAQLFAIGYDHNLSKRTSAYAQYAQVDNDANANFGLGGAGHGSRTRAAAGEDVVSGISLGLRHKF